MKREQAPRARGASMDAVSIEALDPQGPDGDRPAWMSFPNGFGAIVIVIATPLPSRIAASGHSFISLSVKQDRDTPGRSIVGPPPHAYATKPNLSSNPPIAPNATPGAHSIAGASSAPSLESSLAPRRPLSPATNGIAHARPFRFRRVTSGHANTRDERMSLPCPMRRRIRTQPAHQHFRPRASKRHGKSPPRAERPTRSSPSAPIAGPTHLTQPPPTAHRYKGRRPPECRRSGRQHPRCLRSRRLRSRHLRSRHLRSRHPHPNKKASRFPTSRADRAASVVLAFGRPTVSRPTVAT